LSDWTINIKGFQTYLKLEKGLSQNSIDAYSSDIHKLGDFAEQELNILSPTKIDREHIQIFIKCLHDIGISPRSQARILSGIKAFYQYLILEDITTVNPSELIEAPKVGRKLPEVLTVEEINDLLACIDLSKPEGHRNKAIIEILYSCGLRASELTNLKLSN